MALRAAARLKILFPYLARVRAANWSRYQQLLVARARAGDAVTVLQPPARRSDETNFCEIEAAFPEGFRVEEVPLWPRFWNTRFPFDKIVKKGSYSLAANRRVRAIVRTDRPDVLLLYNLTQESLLRGGAPVVFDVADDLPAMLRVEARFAGRGLEAVGRRALARMVGGAALVTTPSRVLLPRLGPGAVFVPNGVDREEIAAARRAAGAGADGKIGFLGSFEYFIDFDFVLGLAARLPSRRFLLIGGGRRLREVRERVDRERLANVELTGPLAHPRALELLAGCAFSLCPFTRDEVGHGASPLKLFESLALAVPVVATRTREIEAERAPNVLFADSAEEASAAIAAYEERPGDVRRREAEEGAAEVLRTRNWETIGDAWAQHVRALSPRAVR
jgi:glycosyltransferase involved in cell wall biosynthesis